jgi:mono/diheme cytochrome c family protein
MIGGILLGTLFLLFNLFGEAAFAESNANAGEKKYLQLCASCHGQSGKGDGPFSKGLPDKPANFTDRTYMATKTDKYLENIITNGGQSMGKSPLMPPFRRQLKPEDLSNLITYIREFTQ